MGFPAGFKGRLREHGLPGEVIALLQALFDAERDMLPPDPMWDLTLLGEEELEGSAHHQALRRQVIQLQIPNGVVGGHVADILHMPPEEPQVGVVVMEVGHPLPRPASKLSDMMWDLTLLGEEELEGSAHQDSYRQFLRSYRREFVYEMMRSV